MTKYIFGISTGETGEFGVGDIVESTPDKVEYTEECIILDEEPVFNLFEIKVDANGVPRISYIDRF